MQCIWVKLGHWAWSILSILVHNKITGWSLEPLPTHAITDRANGKKSYLTVDAVIVMLLKWIAHVLQKFSNAEPDIWKLLYFHLHAIPSVLQSAITSELFVSDVMKSLLSVCSCVHSVIQTADVWRKEYRSWPWPGKVLA